MTYVLIILLSTGLGHAMTSSTFASKGKCEAAGEKAANMHSKIQWVCTKK